MNIQATKEINIDVSNHKYISINAKQYDRNLRYILITCYHDGELLPINNNTCFASIRYRKPNGDGVFNSCEITQDGKILVELTEQMLAVSGICYADVIIHENIKLEVNIVENADGSVEIIDTGDSGILSTMTFVVDVHEAAFDNEEIESSYEYNALNDLLTEARRNYENVIDKSYEYMNTTEGYMKTTKSYMETTEGYKNITKGYMETSEDYKDITISYAVGGTGTRTGEDIDNAKYYYEQSSDNAQSALDSENAAAESANAADASASAASTSEGNAKTYEANASKSADAASKSADAASISEDNAKTYEANASKSETAAAASASAASQYCEEVKNVINGLNSGFIPMGTISFSELSTASKANGYVYNISDDFTTDDTFREGSGKLYTAGTNVYYVEAEDKWDCFAGYNNIATVDEVMTELGI